MANVGSAAPAKGYDGDGTDLRVHRGAPVVHSGCSVLEKAFQQLQRHDPALTVFEASFVVWHALVREHDLSTGTGSAEFHRDYGFLVLRRIGIPREDELLVALDGTVLAIMAARSALVIHHHLKGATHARIHLHGAVCTRPGPHPLREAFRIEPCFE